MDKAKEQQELWGNHHVVPKQAGGNQSSGDPWMKSKDNAVYLCNECHHRVHEDGKYRDGIVAGPETFPYSHGDPNDPTAKSSHEAWSKEVNGKWDARQEVHRSRQR